MAAAGAIVASIAALRHMSDNHIFHVECAIVKQLACTVERMEPQLRRTVTSGLTGPWAAGIEPAQHTVSCEYDDHVTTELVLLVAS
jgi:hypothetical protein